MGGNLKLQSQHLSNMMVGYDSGFGNSLLYLSPAGISEVVGEDTSNKCSEGSVLISHIYESIYSTSANGYMQYSYPVQEPVSAAALGLIPIELLPAKLDIEALYGSQGRPRKYNRSDKAIPAHVLSRRRAQNRASQKAFRKRKEERMKVTEEKLTDLQGRHNELMQSYKRLQVEYSGMKQELETLRCKHEDMCPVPSDYLADINESVSTRANHSDPLLFDVSALCYEPKEDM